jgi:hypothetical protein
VRRRSVCIARVGVSAPVQLYRTRLRLLSACSLRACLCTPRCFAVASLRLAR